MSGTQEARANRRDMVSEEDSIAAVSFAMADLSLDRLMFESILKMPPRSVGKEKEEGSEREVEGFVEEVGGACAGVVVGVTGVAKGVGVGAGLEDLPTVSAKDTPGVTVLRVLGCADLEVGCGLEGAVLWTADLG